MSGVEEFRTERRSLLRTGTGFLCPLLAIRLLGGFLVEPLGGGIAGSLFAVLLAALLLAAGAALLSLGSIRAFRFEERCLRIVRRRAPDRELPWEGIAEIGSSRGFWSGESWWLALRDAGRIRLDVEEFAEKDRKEVYRRINERITSPRTLPPPTAELRRSVS